MSGKRPTKGYGQWGVKAPCSFGCGRMLLPQSRAIHEPKCPKNPDHVETYHERKKRERQEARNIGVPSTELVPVGGNGTARSGESVQAILRKHRLVRDDLLAVVALVFPKGIPTQDTQRLDQILDWVDDTEHLLTMRKA